MTTDILPDSIKGRAVYPFFGDAKLICWGLGSIATAASIRWLLPLPQISPWIRLVGIVIPLMLSYFYVVRLICWTNQWDEMQRRIHFEALTSSALWVVFIRMAIDLLQQAQFRFVDIPQKYIGVEGTFLLMLAFYMLGCVSANRHYR